MQREEVIRMLRKMFSVGALVVVAVTFGVGNAAAKPKNPHAVVGVANIFANSDSDGFSDGRFR
jgi:hypothetical protein